ncbi:transposase family protein [Streptomyces koyangensis]|uniref:Transposase family protein n=1 Tax=Streptomyces koyangensis TaxID=188770 RepID=A0ABX7EG89_9ACTN|nr:transposase family protein [Streptomyces koyangensis]
MIRRYERTRPGELVHVDIKKLGNIPDGGGWRTVGRTAGDRNRQATTSERGSCKPVIGYSYIHSAVDDHSRLACSEVLPDERQHTATAFWQLANAFFAAHGVTVERVLTDNGPCYKSKLFDSSVLRRRNPAGPRRPGGSEWDTRRRPPRPREQPCPGVWSPSQLSPPSRRPTGGCWGGFPLMTGGISRMRGTGFSGPRGAGRGRACGVGSRGIRVSGGGVSGDGPSESVAAGRSRLRSRALRGRLDE